MSAWDSIKNLIGPVAPIIGGLLGGPAGGAVGSMVASALGTPNNPESILQALSDPAAIERIKKLENEHRERLIKMQTEAETARLADINKTMRAEAEASDPYVRRWRPTWGYVTAGAWAVQSLAVFIISIGAVIAAFNGMANEATALFNGAATMLGSLTAQWGVALAVLGVNVYKRSDDKAVAAGKTPAGLLGIFSKQ